MERRLALRKRVGQRFVTTEEGRRWRGRTAAVRVARSTNVLIVKRRLQVAEEDQWRWWRRWWLLLLALGGRRTTQRRAAKCGKRSEGGERSSTVRQQPDGEIRRHADRALGVLIDG